jgi:ABC-type lipopolysaccharide export system ATPase subunit
VRESRFTGAPSKEKVLSVTQLRKVYGDTVAVDGVSFDVQPKQIVGLLRPNGAGKTTSSFRTCRSYIGVVYEAEDLKLGRFSILVAHTLTA